MGIGVLFAGTTSSSSLEMKSEIKVKGPRPLAAAILILEARIRVPITYEDPPYRFQGDIAVSPEGPLIPKPGSIDFVFSDQLELGQILRSLVEGNTKQGNPGIFEVKAAEGIYHVIPVRYRNETGEFVAHNSILDTRISISAQNATGIDIIEMMCKQLSERLGGKVVVGMIPPVPFSSLQKIFTAVDRSANDCLTELIKKTGYNLSWQLFYDPKLRWYALNIHPVGYGGTNASTTAQNASASRLIGRDWPSSQLIEPASGASQRCALERQ